VSLIKTCALIGAVLGQLGFGAFADVLGRRVIFIATLSLTTVGCLLSAFSFGNDTWR
jgi:MFS family permease